MILVVEDNLSKVVNLLDRYAGVFHQQNIFITPYELEAVSWYNLTVSVLQLGEKITVFLDYELPPGCGDGLSVLRILDPRYVEKVYLTTYSPDMGKEMLRVAHEKGLNVGR